MNVFSLQTLLPRKQIMKNKLIGIITFVAVAIMVTGCGRNNYPQQPQQSGNMSENPNAIPYTVASNYFVNNTLESSTTISKRIDTQTEFNRYFGMATTMGNNPTSIDFNNQYVIGLVLPTTNRATTLSVENLTLYRGIVTLSYSQSVSQPQSYYIRPSLIVVVDRKYNGEVLVVEK